MSEESKSEIIGRWLCVGDGGKKGDKITVVDGIGATVAPPGTTPDSIVGIAAADFVAGGTIEVVDWADRPKEPTLATPPVQREREAFAPTGAIAEKREFIRGKLQIIVYEVVWTKAFREAKFEGSLRCFGVGQYVLMPREGGMRVVAEPFGFDKETTEKYMGGVQREEYKVMPAMFPIDVPESPDMCSRTRSANEFEFADYVESAFAKFHEAMHVYKVRVGEIYTVNIRANLRVQRGGMLDAQGNPLIRPRG